MNDQTPSFVHASVLAAPIVEVAIARGVRRIIDCTLGGAGHAIQLLEACPQAHLIGIDRDETAVAVARERLASFGDRARVIHGAFAEVLAEGDGPWAEQGADLLLADFGVSSHQLDTPGRGFSFRADGPLDMRMDPTRGESAAELIARLDADALAQVLFTLGEERYARRVARAVIAAQPRTTAVLADVVRANIPRTKQSAMHGKHKIDAATRTFQALRMAVNDELGQIHTLVARLPHVLSAGGAFAGISFHSLEDRAVKQGLAAHLGSCHCPPALPVCACGAKASMRLLSRKPIVADSEEVLHNPRARSAKLRLAERLMAAA